MSGIDAIIFDLGGVLVHVDEARALERFAARTGRTTTDISEYLRRTSHATEFALGKLTRLRFYRVVAKDLSFDGSYDEFAQIWSEVFSPIEPMVALAESLKTRLPRVILSNTNPLHIDYIVEHYPWINDFDAQILSYEVGLLKPDPAIYELALRRCGLEASRVVFIDDLAANVEAARRVGLEGIQYQSADQVRVELTKLGVTPI
ncbi:MAG TPA: HAD family phosphatase [Verrucomicrobiae bacterium]|nr:HAD family phosphatase [Verrucomicrobiae bacterium]